MAYKHMVVLAQCRATGRFLLREGKQGWTWPAVLENDPEVAMLATGIQEVCKQMGVEELPDDALINYVDVPERSKLCVFHVWVSEELSGEGVEWHLLFDFPDVCDSMITKVLNNKHLQNIMVNPEA